MDVVTIHNTTSPKRSNRLIEQICLIMDDDMFDKYFNTWDDTQVAIMFMKTYALIDKIYKTKFNKKLESEHISNLLYQIMDHHEYRSFMVVTMKEFITTDKFAENMLFDIFSDNKLLNH